MLVLQFPRTAESLPQNFWSRRYSIALKRRKSYSQRHSAIRGSVFSKQTVARFYHLGRLLAATIHACEIPTTTYTRLYTCYEIETLHASEYPGVQIVLWEAAASLGIISFGGVRNYQKLNHSSNNMKASPTHLTTFLDSNKRLLPYIIILQVGRISVTNMSPWHILILIFYKVRIWTPSTQIQACGC